jgi:hypothetical protein
VKINKIEVEIGQIDINSVWQLNTNLIYVDCHSKYYDHCVTHDSDGVIRIYLFANENTLRTLDTEEYSVISFYCDPDSMLSYQLFTTTGRYSLYIAIVSTEESNSHYMWSKDD